MSKFVAHGQFDISLSLGSRILLVVLKGSWNLETAHAYKEAIANKIKPLEGKPWAAITDINEWELYTPECFPVVQSSSLDAIKKGYFRNAIVCGEDSIKMQPLKTSIPEGLGFSREFFRDERSARVWLAKEGFE